MQVQTVSLTPRQPYERLKSAYQYELQVYRRASNDSGKIGRSSDEYVEVVRLSALAFSRLYQSLVEVMLDQNAPLTDGYYPRKFDEPQSLRGSLRMLQ